VKTARIALIGGDGIGPEVVDAALPVIEAAARARGVETGGPIWRTTSAPGRPCPTRRSSTSATTQTASSSVRWAIRASPATSTPRHPARASLPARPVHQLPADSPSTLSPLRADRRTDGGSTAIDFVIFRENTEGQYLGKGRSESIGTPDEVHVSEEINTRKGVARIIEAAFAWAAAHGKTRVTMSDKSNAIQFQRIWGRLFQEIGDRYPDIQREHRYVDALALELVREPERFRHRHHQLYGDILSDPGGLIGAASRRAPTCTPAARGSTSRCTAQRRPWLARASPTRWPRC
jgi:3-isopropylmalate dehydrogenase